MLKLSLEALQVVDAIDRRGSFAKAGQELHKVASTISYVVNKLEDDLQVQLFTRHGTRVELTAAGRELLKDGRSLLRAAGELEQRVRIVQSGWETELTLCLDSMFSPLALQAETADFCAAARHTRLRLSCETLNGPWEALLDQRADLLVGVAGEGPTGGGYVARPLGTLDFVFAVAPSHPLAAIDRPLTRADLEQYRAIVVADSARLSPRTVGLLGQDTLTVPSMQAKYGLQVAGFGFGHLPGPSARAAIARGELVEKQVDEPRAPETFYLAWRSGSPGAALHWWIERLQAGGLFERLAATLPGCESREWHTRA
ncbi:MAG: LysR family transcriptional regulator [Telluria sp.]